MISSQENTAISRWIHEYPSISLSWISASEFSFQAAFTCSKLTIETRKQGVKYVQIYQKRHQSDVTGVILVFLLLTLNIFYTFF